jgi:hypothetical protein
MTTITEDYCSYEVAKLLNEKGFQVDTDKDYWKIGEDGTMYFMCSIGAYTSDPNNKNAFYRPASSYPCPTQSMAMKWLRIEHNIHIESFCPVVDTTGEPVKYNVVISDLRNYCLAFDTPLEDKEFDSYEKACEAAIKYCLENLI